MTSIYYTTEPLEGTNQMQFYNIFAELRTRLYKKCGCATYKNTLRTLMLVAPDDIPKMQKIEHIFTYVGDIVLDSIAQPDKPPIHPTITRGNDPRRYIPGAYMVDTYIPTSSFFTRRYYREYNTSAEGTYLKFLRKYWGSSRVCV